MNREAGHLGTAVVTVSSAKRIKVLSMGEPGVGKSCLIKRFCEGRYVPEYVSTIGIDYGVKPVQVDGQEVKVNFWDVAGDPVYYEIRNEFYKDTNGALLTFDTTNRASFEACERWVKELMTLCSNEVVVFLVANKVSLIDIKPREVSAQEGQALAETLGYRYFETSAQSGEGVESMFTQLFQRVIAAMKGKSSSG
ncbi:P-loop containing nucleoside triphosphate hydrolase protein [Polychytrium aggregatum]|uniref:P-loop containing nucleoside triphosphate hydrolase protein n=1 Tax=Polychytrium aggregatum TaxID=110093 RepID=UPI0022FE1B00|nr:P-loop containing nucleoside triphosphate hydrolase protein [Polychytrium aggregatum]KAI9203929.1 P-loop containing nucleoside triphosphate hydrolase protein [Polychytrium aggregatum]